jgi:hypothetical protein
MTFIDRFIIEQFQLFQDLRPLEEDWRILALLQEECAVECVRFFESALPEESSEISATIKSLELVSSNPEIGDQYLAERLTSFLRHHPELQFPLEKRLQSFVNGIFARTLLSKATA